MYEFLIQFFSFLVYVFIGSKILLVELLKHMESLEFFERGDHMVIYINNEVYTPSDNDLYLRSTYDSFILKISSILKYKLQNT